MIKVRLLRMGAKKQPKFRIVVADERAKRDGRFIEILGHYNPTISPAQVDIKKERYSYWKSVGAQPTKTVTELVRKYEKANRTPS
jgi:small subunit ribosomal protein S16